MGPEASSTLLKERVSVQLDAIELLRAMYPDEDELTIDDATESHIEQLRQWTMSTDDGDIDYFPVSIPKTLSFLLNIKLGDDDTEEGARTIQLTIEIPTTTMGHSATTASLNIRLRQPTWLSRAQTAQINGSIPTEEPDDIVATIEHLRDEARAAAVSSRSETQGTTTTTGSTATDYSSSSVGDGVLFRVWFYFPSLSTRAKRTDLVRYADTYGLTGFVLAGKPGILCLEGSSRDVDEYMRVIKTESWGDIPSHQKKVSERFREVIGPGGTGRAFEGMQEITGAEWMGMKRGERGNRSDMKMLEGWLVDRGLAGVLERVLQM